MGKEALESNLIKKISDKVNTKIFSQGLKVLNKFSPDLYSVQGKWINSHRDYQNRGILNIVEFGELFSSVAYTTPREIDFFVKRDNLNEKRSFFMKYMRKILSDLHNPVWANDVSIYTIPKQARELINSKKEELEGSLNILDKGSIKFQIARIYFLYGEHSNFSMGKAVVEGSRKAKGKGFGASTWMEYVSVLNALKKVR